MYIDYYASLNSPWTHLGAARIEALAAKHGASLRIHPVDFGTIFPASGGLPLPRRAPQRQAYRLMELRRWRDFLGVPIKVQPKSFPSSEELTAPCVIALRETQGDTPAITLAHRVLRSVWQDELNPGDPATLATLITEIGLDANPLTRLPGNSTILKIFEQRLAEKSPFAALYADLNHYKAYNDRYGFVKGDEVLKFTA